MIATWNVRFKTGYNLTDNDRHRICELISDAIDEIAEQYFADYDVGIGYFVPGPIDAG